MHTAQLTMQITSWPTCLPIWISLTPRHFVWLACNLSPKSCVLRPWRWFCCFCLSERNEGYIVMLCWRKWLWSFCDPVLNRQCLPVHLDINWSFVRIFDLVVIFCVCNCYWLAGPMMMYTVSEIAFLSSDSKNRNTRQELSKKCTIGTQEAKKRFVAGNKHGAGQPLQW